jgi:hypothetical protein
LNLGQKSIKVCVVYPQLLFPFFRSSFQFSTIPQEIITMKKRSFELSVFSFQRALLSLVVIALALSLVSLSRLTPQTRAQNGQKMSSAPAPDGATGSPSIVYPATKKGDTVDDYFGTKVADPYRWL